MAVLPLPLTEHDRVDGYWWELSMRQIEVSVDHGVRRATARPGILRGTGGDNLDVGRPDSIELIFTGRHGRRRGRKPKVEPVYKTKVVTRDTLVTVNAFYTGPPHRPSKPP